MDKDKDELLKSNDLLRAENAKLKNMLELYTNSRKTYYEKNKTIINEKAKARLKKINEEQPEKIKEYRRTAYLKRKEKSKTIEK